MGVDSARITGRCLIAMLLPAALISGCWPPPLPPPDELIRTLSLAVLDPATTCAELRDAYGLTDLAVGDNPAQFGLAYEEQTALNPAGQTLRVWYLPAVEPRGVVIISPGNTGPMQCYLFTAMLLVRGGWDAVMYDYQGFGGSSGTPSLRSLRGDLETVLDWTRQRTGSTQVSLYGLSLGSIPSIAVAAGRPAEVNGVILDSPVAMREEIRRFNFVLRGRAEEVIEALDPWLLTEVTILDMYQPLLVFLHELDVISTPQAVEALYDAAPGPKQLVRFPGLPHAVGQFLQTGQYDAALQQFLRLVWSVAEDKPQHGS